MNLYEISEDIRKLETLIDEAEFISWASDKEVNSEGLQEALTEAMAESQLDLSDKVSNIVKMLRSWEATAEAIKSEETRLAKRRTAINNKHKTLKSYLLVSLQKIDAPKLVLDIATVSRAKGRESVVIDDELDLPQGYYKTEAIVKPEKTALKKLWNATPEDARKEFKGFHVERDPESLTIR